MAYSIGGLIGTVLVSLIYALIAIAVIRPLTKAFAGFRPTWGSGIGACVVGFSIIFMAGIALDRYEHSGTFSVLLKHDAILSLLGLVVYSLSHLAISRNRVNEKPTAKPLILMSVVQIGLRTGCAMAAWYLMHLNGKPA